MSREIRLDYTACRPCTLTFGVNALINVARQYDWPGVQGLLERIKNGHEPTLGELGMIERMVNMHVNELGLCTEDEWVDGLAAHMKAET